MIKNNSFWKKWNSIFFFSWFKIIRRCFFNICEFIKKQSKCKYRSTSLHEAVFYNQEFIIQLLLEYGANTSIRNRFSALPSDDARSQLKRDNILNSQQDKISILSNYLINKKLVKYKVQIIGKKKWEVSFTL